MAVAQTAEGGDATSAAGGGSTDAVTWVPTGAGAGDLCLIDLHVDINTVAISDSQGFTTLESTVVGSDIINFLLAKVLTVGDLAGIDINLDAASHTAWTGMCFDGHAVADVTSLIRTARPRDSGNFRNPLSTPVPPDGKPRMWVCSVGNEKDSSFSQWPSTMDDYRVLGEVDEAWSGMAAEIDTTDDFSVNVWDGSSSGRWMSQIGRAVVHMTAIPPANGAAAGVQQQQRRTLMRMTKLQ